MTKKRLLKIIFDQAKGKKPNIDGLMEFLNRGMPAVLFTKENPFKLFKMLEKNKSSAPAKPGQIAPKDIKVSAGPTQFAPGPIISEFGKLGIKTSVQNGKIAILSDATLVSEGEEISQSVSDMMSKLGIEPMEIGLDLMAVYEDGIIYDKKVLAVDESKYIEDITNAARWSFNLSVEAGYINKDNAEVMITKAFKDARGLAIESVIPATGIMDELIAKATRQMLSLKQTAKLEE